MKKATYKNIPTFYNYKKWVDKYNNKGYLYYLSDKLTEKEKNDLLNKYNNITFYTLQLEYAKEITKDVIFIKN